MLSRGDRTMQFELEQNKINNWFILYIYHIYYLYNNNKNNTNDNDTTNNKDDNHTHAQIYIYILVDYIKGLTGVVGKKGSMLYFLIGTTDNMSLAIDVRTYIWRACM